MEVRFTPGPWLIAEEVGNFWLTSDTRDSIAHVPLDDADEDALAETRANLSLIAAAPRLHSAAAALVARYDWLYRDMDVDYAAFFTALSAEVDALRSALHVAEEGGGS